MLLSEGHHKRGLPLERIAELTATNPARLMGLAHVQGRDRAGAGCRPDVVDPNATWTVGRDDVLSSAGYSIYEGWQFTGKVVHATVRGAAVLRDGALWTTRWARAGSSGDIWSGPGWSNA